MLELIANLFGTPAVSVDGREITLPYKKADALLYYLLLKRKTTRSELIGLLYEDTDSATALKNQRHAIYTIRKACAFDPFVPGQRSIVEFSADVEIACDVYDFERGDMLSAYHGEFLKDFNVSHSSAFDAWLSDQRNLYQSQYLHQLMAAEKARAGGGGGGGGLRREARPCRKIRHEVHRHRPAGGKRVLHAHAGLPRPEEVP